LTSNAEKRYFAPSSPIPFSRRAKQINTEFDLDENLFVPLGRKINTNLTDVFARFVSTREYRLLEEKNKLLKLE
jgi:hypothetical protein